MNSLIKFMIIGICVPMICGDGIIYGCQATEVSLEVLVYELFGTHENGTQ